MSPRPAWPTVRPYLRKPNQEIGVVPRGVECLPRVNKALCGSPAAQKPGAVAHTCNSSIPLEVEEEK